MAVVYRGVGFETWLKVFVFCYKQYRNETSSNKIRCAVVLICFHTYIHTGLHVTSIVLLIKFVALVCRAVLLLLTRVDKGYFCVPVCVCV